MATLWALSGGQAFAADADAWLWADFTPSASGAPRLVSHRGAPVKLIALSEKPGDVSADGLAWTDGAVRVSGRISRQHGSQWSTLGLEVAAGANAAPVNLSAYQSLRLRLSSASPRMLRIRLKGSDVVTQNEGCYPVVFQRVGPQSDLEIPLSAFEPEPYCGARGASIAQTLPAVVQVEVTANDAGDAPVRFEVGRIEFTRPQPAALAVPSAPPSAATPTPAAGDARDIAWKLAWADEFNASAGSGIDDKRWLNNKVPASTTPVHDGSGHLAVSAPFSMQVRNASALTHGRIEVRLKLPTAGATRISLRGAPLAELNWPEEGEIALLENDGTDTHLALYAPGIDEDAAYQAALPTARLHDGFHTLALEWEPRRWRWQLDGATVKTITAEQLPPGTREVFERWPFLLRIEALAASNTPLLIDHVRVFQNDELAAAARPRLAAWLAARGRNEPVPAAAAPRPQAARPPVRRAEAPAPAPAPRTVTCERNKFGLMMCY